MSEPWWDQAIRDHEAEHGPSGAAWNISMILERLRRASPTPTNDGEGLIEALDHIKFGMEFAYKHGLHEFGYDPVKVVLAALNQGAGQ